MSRDRPAAWTETLVRTYGGVLSELEVIYRELRIMLINLTKLQSDVAALNTTVANAVLAIQTLTSQVAELQAAASSGNTDAATQAAIDAIDATVSGLNTTLAAAEPVTITSGGVVSSGSTDTSSGTVGSASLAVSGGTSSAVTSGGSTVVSSGGSSDFTTS